VTSRTRVRKAALADLVVAQPILSAGLIARELKVSPRAAQDLVAELYIWGGPYEARDILEALKASMTATDFGLNGFPRSLR
jgi:hypothetical protein